MRFKAVNHNGTLLGEFDTYDEADAEAREYTFATGNSAHVEELSDDEPA